MSFQWLQMRITEENERRQREAQTLERLPAVMDEVHQAVAECVAAYAAAFGPESIELSYFLHKARVTIRDLKEGKWEKVAKIEICTLTKPPSLHVDRNGDVLDLELGLLPGEKMFYKDGDKFLTMEELTRRILDRMLFPKLAADT
ncbi:MAG TPA: hypothetical protein VHW09_24595 [Bryobacteraceae bacterium]|jgi:hypothetical protein|nr:hypothetical protein [Bryobacteraceae bacterium]